jgi:N-acylneuraminate cytidylyltransferase
VRVLAGHPTLAYTIRAAIDSEVFTEVVVSTNDPATADIAVHYGARVPFLRPAELATATSPDIEWVGHALDSLADAGIQVDVFALLRPTSPLRLPGTIRRAAHQLADDLDADSLRAVEPCRQHPGKMWIVEGQRMRPLLRDAHAQPPWHSRAYQALPVVHAQNASLEIARRRCVDDFGTIAGEVVRPFICHGHEGFDVNDERDWRELVYLVDSGEGHLPTIDRDPYPVHPHARAGGRALSRSR